MSSLLLLVLLWAGAGILLAVRWSREQARALADAGGAAPGEPVRFGRRAEDGSGRRAQAMRAAYAAGATCCGVGFVAGIDVVLAFGASLLNLGTVYRYLLVALDHARADAPLFERGRPGLLALADVAEQPAG